MKKTLTFASAGYVNLALRVATITALLIAVVPFRVDAADSLLVYRSIRISSQFAGATVTHTFGFTLANTTQAIASISLEYCSNDPIPNTPCTAPTGFDASGAVLADQQGDVGFSIDTVNSTANKIILTRGPLNPLGVPSTYQFDNIINPTGTGTHYVRLQTYTSADATGVDIENGGVVFVILDGVNVSAEVPPYIRFCAGITITAFDCATATTFFIDLGNLSKNFTTTASSQFMVATNAPSGYSVTITGTTMTSGNNVIPALAVPAAAVAGTSQFGLNLRANTNPVVGQEPVGMGTASIVSGYNTPNQFKFANGDAVVSSAVPDYNRKFTVSYVTNISAAQAPGVYATTVSYICLANF